MPVASRRVRTRQTAPHPRLLEVVDRHREHPTRRPVAEHTRAAWRAIRAELRRAPDRPLVLDAGCGTGASTYRLAERHPAAWILGVDRSAHRLGLDEARVVVRRSDRILLARAELGDLYRLMAGSGARLGAHYLLYPNPWPKPGHLLRRWPAHPAFLDLLALGGLLEARTNWRVYLEELALAVRRVTGASAAPEPLVAAEPLSPFERKYAASGHPLYRLTVSLKPERDWPSREKRLLKRSEADPG